MVQSFSGQLGLMLEIRLKKKKIVFENRCWNKTMQNVLSLVWQHFRRWVWKYTPGLEDLKPRWGVRAHLLAYGSPWSIVQNNGVWKAASYEHVLNTYQVLVTAPYICTYSISFYSSKIPGKEAVLAPNLQMRKSELTQVKLPPKRRCKWQIHHVGTPLADPTGGWGFESHD